MGDRFCVTELNLHIAMSFNETHIYIHVSHIYTQKYNYLVLEP